MRINKNMYKLNIDITGLEVLMEEPSEVAFWIRNEISDYKNIASDAEKWCETAKVGDTYINDFVVIKKENK